ncbi:MAG: hypothetical protein ACW987_08995 [Candidatus Thorarchaeota archaeon]|jgi:hypothetical protein
MTEDHQKLYTAIMDVKERVIKLETKQAVFHDQNQKDLGAIASLTRSQEKHCHEIGKLKVHRAVHWVMLGAIAVAIILT